MQTNKKHFDAATSPHNSRSVPQQARQFLDWLFEPGDIIESRCGTPPTQKRWHKADNVSDDVDELLAQAGVFVGINPRIREGLSGDDNIKHARVVFVDFDPDEREGETTYSIARAERAVEQARLPYPHALVSSGRGVHAYWRLSEPIPPNEFRDVQQRLSARLGGDPVCKNPERIMRLPGSINWKDQEKPKPVELVHCIDEHCGLDLIKHCLPKPKAQAAPRDPLRPDESRPLPGHIASLIVSGTSKGSRNADAFKIAAACKGNGLPIKDARRHLKAFANNCRPPMNFQEAVQVVASAFSKDRNPTRDQAKLSAKTPYATAEAFIGSRYTNGATSTLLHHRGDFYAYDGIVYRPVSKDRLRAEVYPFIEPHYDPTRNNVTGVIDAIEARAYIREDMEPPVWLDGAEKLPPANELLPMANGVLHLSSRRLLPHDPQLFAINALDFGYDPAAEAPQWIAFLNSIWPDDREQQDTLQEWIGYLISGSTTQQKIGLIVGPKRSGKGTIGTVITKVAGPANCCSPTLPGLALNFGMQPLIGKRCAIISDARLGRRSDEHALAERLLNTSGEDTQTIDRKHRDPWTGKLGVRFTIMSNELPKLTDASGALAGRFVAMQLSKSFYGTEDTGLAGRLQLELPGIFNWALEGLGRLKQRGHFVQPESSQDAIEQLQDLGSPINAFVREHIDIGPTDAPPTCGAAYNLWKVWCQEQGVEPGCKSSFGRDLSAAIPNLKTKRPRSDSKERKRLYQGITLKR